MTTRIQSQTTNDLAHALEHALHRRSEAQRVLMESLLLLEVAERDAPGTIGELEARCAADLDALQSAEREVRRLAR